MKAYQRLTWWFLRTFYGTILKRSYHIECRNRELEPDVPYILLSNHFYFTDGFHIGTCLKRPVRYLGSDEFTSFTQEFLDNSVALMYIDKGRMKPQAISNVLRALKSGDPVGIFPEGDGTWDGETAEFPQKIVKLLKFAGVPVLTVRNNGGYLTKPRWAETFRHGKIILEFDLISAEDVKRLSSDELYQLIHSKIYSNELKNPLVGDVEYRGKNLASGVQYLLWKCPVCGAEDHIVGQGDRIVCEACGRGWDLSGRLGVTPAPEGIVDLKDWSDWQRAVIRERAAKAGPDDILTSSEGVSIGFFSEVRKTLFHERLEFTDEGTAKVALTRKALRIEWPDGRALSFDVRGLAYCVECMNWYLKFYYKEVPYKLSFGGRNSQRFLYFIEEAQRLWSDEDDVNDELASIRLASSE